MLKNKIQTRLKRNKKTIFIIAINEKIWGILPSKILKQYSQNNEEFFLDEDETNKLISEIEIFSFTKLLNFLSYRERAISEVNNYLKNLPILKEIGDKLYEKAKKYNFFSNERFSENFIISQVKKAKSEKEIIYKLKAKEINEDLIKKYIDKYYLDYKEEIVQKNLEKVLKKYAHLENKEKINKCINYMYNKGFNFSDFYELLKRKIFY